MEGGWTPWVEMGSFLFFYFFPLAHTVNAPNLALISINRPWEVLKQ